MFTWDRIKLYAILFVFVVVSLVIWAFRETIQRAGGLCYPSSPQALYLDKQIDHKDKSGSYAYGLGAGPYLEVLTNEQGSFYLAPPMGFFVFGTRGNNGFGVGGIYVPANADGKYRIWQYMLKNEHRTMAEPRVDRVLSPEYDQPERALFLEPEWYADKPLSLTGWPLIIPDTEIPASAFRQVPPEYVPDLLTQQR